MTERYPAYFMQICRVFSVFYRFKIIVHQGGPLFPAAKGRNEAPDEENGIADRIFIFLPQIRITLFAERVWIQIDHVPMDKAVGGQTLQDPVDLTVPYVTGQSEQNVEQQVSEQALADEINRFLESISDINSIFISICVNKFSILALKTLPYKLLHVRHCQIPIVPPYILSFSIQGNHYLPL